jgi:hypothetical protein
VGFDKGSVPPAIIRSQENFILVRDSSLWRKATAIVYETEQPCRVTHQEVDIEPVDKPELLEMNELAIA